MSLGGHATLMSSYINEFNVDAYNQPHYASSLALCPVINLKPSIDFLFADNLRGDISRTVLQRNIEKEKANSPLLTEIHSKIGKLSKNSMIPSLIAGYSADYYSRRPQEWMLPPLNEHPISTAATLWQENDLFKFLSTPIQTPTLVFSAATDWVVTPDQNALRGTGAQRPRVLAGGGTAPHRGQAGLPAAGPEPAGAGGM